MIEGKLEFSLDQAEAIRKSKVTFMVPCYGGAVFEKFFTSMLKTCIANSKYGIDFAIETITNDSLVTRARNNLVAKAMSRPDATHLMFIDADIGFKPGDVYQLIAADKDIVGGLYPKKQYPLDYVIEELSGSATDDAGLQEVRHIGTGFMLIKRHVIEAMFEQYAELRYSDDLGLDSAFQPYMYNLFDTTISGDRCLLSEDYTFCNRWRELGGQIFAHTKVKLSHSGYHTFSENAEPR
jgi:hypothetical protein